MRRDSKIKAKEIKSASDKIILYVGIGIAVLAVIVFALFMYSKTLSDDVKNSTMSLEQMANIASNNNTTTNDQDNNTKSASSQIGKSVEDSKNEVNNTSSSNLQSTNNQNNTSNTSNAANTNNSSNNTKKTTSNTAKTNDKTKKTQEETTKKELSFVKPVEGDIVREFAKNNLVYSETLKEWVTHMGVDIKAEKTTVVKAAEEGTVKSIKNDPRYGLTIVIEHENGFQTVYSNLLTSEFVVEGEKVKKEQSIGTVGNTAAFEIADEPHLHFEILKDSIQVDPNIYIK